MSLNNCHRIVMNVRNLNGYTLCVKTQNDEIKMTEQKKASTPSDILAVRQLEKVTKKMSYDNFKAEDKRAYFVASVSKWQKETKEYLQHFSPNGLEKAIFSLSKTHIKPDAEWLAAWEKQAVDVMNQFPTDKLVTSLHSFAYLGVHPSSELLSAALGKLETELGDKSQLIGAVPISKALQACAVFRSIDSSFNHPAVDILFDRLQVSEKLKRRDKLRYHEAATIFDRPANKRPIWDDRNTLFADRLERDEEKGGLSNEEAEDVLPIIEGVHGVERVTAESYNRTLLEAADFRVTLKVPIKQGADGYKRRPEQTVFLQVDDEKDYTLVSGVGDSESTYQYNGLALIQNAVAEKLLGKNEQLVRIPARNDEDRSALKYTIPAALNAALSKPDQKVFTEKAAGVGAPVKAAPEPAELTDIVYESSVVSASVGVAL